MLEAANDVCGKTKGNQQHNETWWWNDKIAEVIKEKQRLYKIYDKSRKGVDKLKTEVCKNSYLQAKCAAKKEISKAQGEGWKTFCEMLFFKHMIF